MAKTLDEGADEYDVVMNVRLFKTDEIEFKRELRALLDNSGGLPIKLIIETDLLTDDEVARATYWAVKAGIDIVKTSTGFIEGGKGAQVEHVDLMRRTIATSGSDLMHEIKASGGIRKAEDALALLNAGADILGSSSGSALLDEFDALR